MSDNEAEKRVKELLDDATRADLERWFNLPSFEQVAEQEAKAAQATEDPDSVALLKRRADALAAVDPALVEAHRRRVEPDTELHTFKAVIDVRVDPDLPMIDLPRIERQHTVAEPRDYERPSVIEDDLRERTPQALLRDLHRPVLEFRKEFEIVDVSAEQQFDIVAAVDQAMKTSWRPPPAGKSSFQEASSVLRDLREYRRLPWCDIKTPNRQVTE